jgi:hypothetical protein
MHVSLNLKMNLNSTEQSKISGFYEHGTEVLCFKKQTPCGPALEQSTLNERKNLSTQLEVGVEIPPCIFK